MQYDTFTCIGVSSLVGRRVLSGLRFSSCRMLLLHFYRRRRKLNTLLRELQLSSNAFRLQELNTPGREKFFYQKLQGTVKHTS